MTLSEALTVLREQSGTAVAGRKINVFLACGFQPLHLQTFLRAEIATRFADASVEVETGLYGDLEGTLRTATSSQAEAAAVVIEWSDLDSRLGLRSSGGWGPAVERDIVENCRERFERLLSNIFALASHLRVAVVGPTLPRLLFGHTAGWQAGMLEAELDLHAAQFAANVAKLDNVALLRASRLARLSPEGARLDAKMELTAGFPYTLAHASTLASQLVRLLFPPPPMKGLITDLDDTLWSGLVGEIGAAEVSWRLADHAQIHGLYQQQLRQLWEMGVLVGVVSKNEPDVVEEALGRADMYIPRDAFYPVRAGWKEKSIAVGEILAAWNIGPESVVFVDDSAMELAEVNTAFPAMACLQLPVKNPGKAVEFFEQLRDLFGKSALHREDQLRQTSIRAAAEFQREQVSGADFLRKLQGKVTFDARKDPGNKRLLELVNKTNQFNLNGVRLTEGEWRQLLNNEESVVVSVGYEDKFGPLGVIAVAAGRKIGARLELTTWVLSCRAFSRRIEHHTLDYLFDLTGAKIINLAFKPTERNQPLREFLVGLGLAPATPGGELKLRRDDFMRAELPHHVVVDDARVSTARP